MRADGQPVKFYRPYLYAQHDPDSKQQEVIAKAKALAADMQAGRGLPKTLTVATHDTNWTARVVKDVDDRILSSLVPEPSGTEPTPPK